MLFKWLAKPLAFLAALPAAIWIWRQEKRICMSGEALTDAELVIANRLGVDHPERLRILVVSVVPFPCDRVLRRLAGLTSRYPVSAVGLCARYGIFLQEGDLNRVHTLAHELVHTVQYERLGGILQFLMAYLEDCLVNGYADAVLEHEARDLSSDVMRRRN